VVGGALLRPRPMRLPDAEPEVAQAIVDPEDCPV
jgi:hypothetical protein